MARTLEKSKGRRSQGNFAAIPVSVLLSAEYHDLTGGAVRLLVALAAQYNGHNNGNLCAALSTLKRYGLNSSDVISRGLLALLEVGLIIKTRDGYFNGGHSQCALYAIAWKAINDCPGKGLTVQATLAPPRCFLPANISPRKQNAHPETGRIELRKSERREPKSD